MNTLYDSESFTVTHILANAETEGLAVPGNEMAALEGTPVLARHGFEIVDKRTGKEIYLDGSWAEYFHQRIQRWQDSSPTQEEVEETLDQFSVLAQNPVVVH
ncbi:DUF3567 domain-containing protein [Curvibacter sp. CHRR-16]|uniref:BTH_I0359 family protein n=1 Tax=Curvibacter sp. CHRR-16 TaxID=2835872 RepID=UPI001BDA4755|nr:DUF3567 domain-containing protein [Curvibacter sp. CHRR-16]MBT0569835.1 DUF3567 domain-containing protein [Curvibacter sp. CHRR-16]